MIEIQSIINRLLLWSTTVHAAVAAAQPRKKAANALRTCAGVLDPEPNKIDPATVFTPHGITCYREALEKSGLYTAQMIDGVIDATAFMADKFQRSIEEDPKQWAPRSPNMIREMWATHRDRANMPDDALLVAAWNTILSAADTPEDLFLDSGSVMGKRRRTEDGTEEEKEGQERPAQKPKK